MKKMFVIFLSVILCVSLFSIQAFAITDTQYISYLKEKGFAQEYINYAENHFKSYKYSSAQLDTLKMYSDKVLEIVMVKNPEVITKGSTKFVKSNFTNAEENLILDYVVKSADSLGLRAVITRGPDSIRYIDFYNKAGKKIGSITPKYNTLKYTDGTFSLFMNYIYITMMVVLVLAIIFIIVKKPFRKKEVSK